MILGREVMISRAQGIRLTRDRHHGDVILLAELLRHLGDLGGRTVRQRSARRNPSNSPVWLCSSRTLSERRWCINPATNKPGACWVLYRTCCESGLPSCVMQL